MVHAVWIDLCMVWVINTLPWCAQGGSYFGGGPVQRQTRAGAGFHINTSLGCQLAGSHCNHTWHTDLQPRERTLGGTQCPWCYAGNLSLFVSGYLSLSFCLRVSLAFSLLSLCLRVSLSLSLSLFSSGYLSLFQGVSFHLRVSLCFRVSLFQGIFLSVSGSQGLSLSLCLWVSLSLFVSGYLSDRVWDSASLTENEWARD